FIPLLFFCPSNGQTAVRKFDFDILLVETWDFRLDFKSLVRLDDIDGRPEAGRFGLEPMFEVVAIRMPAFFPEMICKFRYVVGPDSDLRHKNLPLLTRKKNCV